MAIHRDVSLTARADQGSPQLDLRRVVDVVKIDPVIVTYKNMVATEGQIRVGRTVLNRRRLCRLTRLRWLRGVRRRSSVWNETTRGEAGWLGHGGNLLQSE